MNKSSSTSQASSKSGGAQAVISLPKGGGAIKGIGETFQPNLFSGTGNHAIPLAVSPGRGGFGPKLSLEYSSGNGNGPFGLGWQLSVPHVTRKQRRAFLNTTAAMSLCCRERKTWSHA